MHGFNGEDILALEFCPHPSQKMKKKLNEIWKRMNAKIQLCWSAVTSGYVCAAHVNKSKMAQ